MINRERPTSATETHAQAPSASRLSIARLAKLAMVAGAMLATLATAFTARAIHVQAEDEEWVAHTLEARQQIATLLSTVRGAATGTRVFRMTHVEANLEPYHAALEAIPVELRDLEVLTSDNPVQQSNVARLRALIAERLARLAQSLEGPEPTVVWLEANNLLMREVRTVADRMDAEEVRLLALRRGEARGNGHYAQVVSSVGLVCSFSLVILGWWLQRKDLKRETEMVRLLHIGSQVSNESSESREALASCLDRMCEATGWMAAHAHVLEGKQMVSTGLWHLPQGRDFARLRESVAALPIDPGMGLVGRAMQAREPTWLGDLRAERSKEPNQAVHEEMRRVGIQGVLALPVMAGDEVLAVLEFMIEKPAAPDPALLEIMASIGVQLGRVFERERAEARRREQGKTIEALAVTDALTGLLNRRGFVTMAVQQLKVCRRTTERSLLFFMDMDGLKKINDELGHAAGDAALQEVAVVLRCTFREADLVARLGGDEFVAFAQGGADIGAPLCERIQENLRGRVAGEDPRFPLAISVGLRWVEPDGGSSVEELLALADRAMYEEKRARRDRKALPSG